MVRSYIRVMPDLYARKILNRKNGSQPYTPTQFSAFVGMLCAAEAVSPRGRFPSRAVLAAMLAGDGLPGARAVSKQVDFLIEQGDLVAVGDGSYYVDGWDELQEGRDPTVADRVRRYRHRDRNGQ